MFYRDGALFYFGNKQISGGKMETRRGGGLKDWREGSKRCKLENTVWHLEKYILKFGKIHFEIWANSFWQQFEGLKEKCLDC